MTFLLYLQTNRFLRKPKIELFEMNSQTKEEVVRSVRRFRPKAQIVSIREICVLGENP